MGLCQSQNSEIEDLHHEVDLQYKDIKVALEALEALKKDMDGLRKEVENNGKTVRAFVEEASKQGDSTQEIEKANQKSIDIMAKDMEDLRRGLLKILADVDQAKTGIKPSKSSESTKVAV